MNPEYTWILTTILSGPTVTLLDGTLDVVVLNSAPVSYELYDRLCAKSRLSVCTDGGANIVYENYKDSAHSPSVIIGDFDSVSPETLTYFGNRGSIIIHEGDQDNTDLDKALKYIQLRYIVHPVRTRSQYVYILGTVGSHEGRLDQFVAAIRSMYVFGAQFQLVSIGQRSITIVLLQGTHRIVIPRSWIGSYCGIAPMFGAVDHIITTGLKWNMDGPTSFEGVVSTSNRIDEETVTMSTSHAVVFTITSVELL